MSHKRGVVAVTLLFVATGAARAEFTNNIMLTGYWPPSNEMVRGFSTSPEQNPDGWEGLDWEGLGYDVYSFFPEFPGELGRGVGDFEVDYQDTSADFWRIVEEVQPVAIMAFGRGSNNYSWEVEWQYRNLERYDWVADYTPARRPTPSPPDASVAPGAIRYSTLPMDAIAGAVNAEPDIEVDAFVDDTGFAGAFLCEYIGYHTAWYHDLHADASDSAWNVASGQIHVGARVSEADATIATELSLRELIGYVETQVPEPTTAGLLLVASTVWIGRRRRY